VHDSAKPLHLFLKHKYAYNSYLTLFGESYNRLVGLRFFSVVSLKLITTQTEFQHYFIDRRF